VTKDIKRFPTFVGGLDEMLEGGFPREAVILFSGRAGSMKSSLAFSILYNLARTEGIKCIYLSLEQRSESLLRHMNKLGMDPEKNAKDMMILDLGKLRDVTELDFTLEQKDWMPHLLDGIRTYKENMGCDIVAIDSLDALYALSPMTNPRIKLFHFIEGLRDLNISTFLITEIREEHTKFGHFGIESFLADGIIHLDLVRDGKNVHLYIGIAKMRETNHSRDYFPLLVDKDGFNIVKD
jgi:KaiC/GvpD/RAD55 family RecA-like ATPase